MILSGEYLSLEEASKAGFLDRYAKEQSSVGNKEPFDLLLERMAKSKVEQKETPDK